MSNNNIDGETTILLERYKTAVGILYMHDTILWTQSSIFLIAEITILGFSLPSSEITRLFFSLGGIAVAGLWLFVQHRRHHHMETVTKLKNKTADRLVNKLKDMNPPLEFIDVDNRVHEEGLKP